MSNKTLEIESGKYERKELILTNELIGSFLAVSENVTLVKNFLDSPSRENRINIEKAIRNFFISIRLIKYISNLILYCEIDFQRKATRVRQRNHLIYDKPLEGDSCISYGELLLNRSYSNEFGNTNSSDPQQFKEMILDQQVYSAFMRLTPKQQKVITLVYCANKKDTEVSVLLGVTPQAITKTRVTALKKMKIQISKGV